MFDKDPGMSDPTKYLLEEHRLPTAWYNINADLPVPLMPPLHPETKQPSRPSISRPLR